MVRIKNPIIELIFRSIRDELPYREKMDEYIDYILPRIRRYSEGLDETHFYLEKRWREMRDDLQFHEAVLHIFKPQQQPLEIKVKDEDQGAAYLYSVNGNITKGTWSHMGQTGMIIKHLTRYELYDLVFLSDDFLIMRKHGEQYGDRKYLFLMNERLANGLEWRESMELLYDIHRYNLAFLLMIVFVIVIGGGILILSIPSC